MCELSIKVAIRKKSGNLFNDPRICNSLTFSLILYLLHFLFFFVIQFPSFFNSSNSFHSLPFIFVLSQVFLPFSPSLLSVTSFFFSFFPFSLLLFSVLIFSIEYQFCFLSPFISHFFSSFFSHKTLSSFEHSALFQSHHYCQCPNISLKK